MPELRTAKSAGTKSSRRVSTPVVRPAVYDDFQRIVRLVDSTRHPTDPSLENSLARHFSVPWQTENSPGYVLVDGPEIVGFLASLTHTRQVRGELQTIRNMGSWYVNAAYRKNSLSMIYTALSRHDITYTAISPIDRVARIATRFGFHELETHQRIIYPMMSLRRLRPRPSIAVGDVSSLLSGELLKIFQDHQHLPCEHAVLEHDGRQCYMVLVRKSRRLFSSARIEYLSDQSLFRSCIPHIAAQLCRKLQVTSVNLPDRFLGDVRIPFSKRIRMKIPQMFRSSSLSAADLDSLYSECVVMGF
jgi:hypothetical protein